MSTGTPYSQGEFCWNELGTRDIDAALKFYKELFGWSTLSHDMGEHGTYYMFQLAGKDVGAAHRMFGPQFEGIPPHWACYVWVDDVDAAGAKAGALGGQVILPPLDVPNVGRMALLKDPQGAAFAVFKGKEHQGAARLGPKPGTFCWNELRTTDAAGARRFYSSLLGWSCIEVPMGPGVTYTVCKVGETNAAGMAEMHDLPAHWFSYVSVADCDASASKAANLGATVAVPPTDIPKTGRFAIIKDPSGAGCGLLYLLPM